MEDAGGDRPPALADDADADVDGERPAVLPPSLRLHAADSPEVRAQDRRAVGRGPRPQETDGVRQQGLDRPAQQLVAMIAEHRLDPGVDQRDPARPVDQGHAVRRGLQHGAEAGFARQGLVAAAGQPEGHAGQAEHRQDQPLPGDQVPGMRRAFRLGQLLRQPRQPLDREPAQGRRREPRDRQHDRGRRCPSGLGHARRHPRDELSGAWAGAGGSPRIVAHREYRRWDLNPHGCYPNGF